ncbi:MAG: hypothetical protein AB7I19_19940 [Planctomycetota bacterium]
MRARSEVHVSLLALALLAACSQDSDLAPVYAAIERSVRGPDGDFACRVENIELGSFVETTTPLGPVRSANWSAVLIADDELVAILDRIDGHDLFVKLADRGAVFRFAGDVEVRGPTANRRIEAKVTGSELREVEVAARTRLATGDRATAFRLRSARRLVDPIAWDTAEGSSLRARLEARREAEMAAPHERLLSVVAPPLGALLRRDGDDLRASRLIATSVDPAAGLAQGRGTDLSSIPPREFQFELRSDPRGAGALELTQSGHAAVLRFTRGDEGWFRAGREYELQPADEARSAAFTAVATALQAAATTIPLDAAASPIEPMTGPAPDGFVEVALLGSVVHEDRVDRARASLFRIPPGTPTNWREGRIAVRLTAPVSVRGLLVRGGAVASGAFEVQVNGRLYARVESLAAESAAIVRLPDGAQVLDVAIVARAALSLRSVSALR